MKIEGWEGPIHPAAELFPLMDGDEFASLVDSIKAQGLREAAWLTADGALLDGRNRVRACRAAGVKPSFRQYDGDDPVRTATHNLPSAPTPAATAFQPLNGTG